MPKPAGAVIRSLRQRCGIKTGAFAVLVGISRQHMTAIEAYDVPASIEVLNRIAEHLDVDVKALTAIDQASAVAK